MFSNQDLSFIVNLTGTAEIYLHEADAMKRIWGKLRTNRAPIFSETLSGVPALS